MKVFLRWYTKAMQDARQEIRDKLNIEDVIGEYVELKRAGRNFKGLSPFTSERTPSFVVSPDKNIWHDFSSGRGGDLFGFVMEVEGMDFRAALEHLARKAGVDLSKYETRQSGEIAKKKRRLAEANELAARYFQQCLIRNQHALEYVFKTRGLSKEVVQEFRIGYAPSDGYALIKMLKRRGFSKKELSQAGLTNQFGGDIFRGRMTVPLMDGGGQVVGFTGRIIVDVSDAPKYLNTPATLLYDKSRHVFGLAQAKEAIRKSDGAVVVEGNLDVVSSHQAGVKNVVATAGTAMTEWHLKALSRLSHNVKLAFDGDKAGLAATERAIPIAQNAGVELTIVSLPDSAKDPDELIKQDVGLWTDAIEKAEPAVEWVFRQYLAREDMTSAAGKRRFTTAALSVVRSLDDAVEREHYMKKIARATDVSLEAVRAKFADEKSDAPKQLRSIKANVDAETVPTHNAVEDMALGMLLVYPATRQLLEEFSPDIFSDDQRKQLAIYLKSHQEEFKQTPKDLQQSETYVKIVELKAETRYGSWQEADIQSEAAQLLRQIVKQQQKRTTEQLLEKLRVAESNDDDDAIIKLRTELSEQIKEMGRG